MSDKSPVESAPKPRKLSIEFWAALIGIITGLFAISQFVFNKQSLCEILNTCPDEAEATTVPADAAPASTSEPTATAIPSPLYLSELEPIYAEVGWGAFSAGKYSFTSTDPADHIFFGDPIRAHDTIYPHGLVAHAPSSVIYELPTGYEILSGSMMLGLGETLGYCGDGARFSVLVDDELRYESQIIKQSTNPVVFEVDVAEGRQLELVTAPEGSELCDWAIWGDPALEIRTP